MTRRANKCVTFHVNVYVACDGSESDAVNLAEHLYGDQLGRFIADSEPDRCVVTVSEATVEDADIGDDAPCVVCRAWECSCEEPE